MLKHRDPEDDEETQEAIEFIATIKPLTRIPTIQPLNAIPTIKPPTTTPIMKPHIPTIKSSIAIKSDASKVTSKPEAKNLAPSMELLARNQLNFLQLTKIKNHQDEINEKVQDLFRFASELPRICNLDRLLLQERMSST